MQASFQRPSQSSPIPIPWKKTPENLDRTSLSPLPNPPSSPSTPHLKPLVNGRDSPAPPQPLPLVIHRAGRTSQYWWDGNRLRLVPFNRSGGEEFSDDRRQAFVEEILRISRVLTSAIRKLFVPQQVQRNYMDYLKWKLLHRVFSSALQVLATQAMFRAIGFGSSQSLPSAAALNWVLKDGLGRLSRCIYTASLGSAFDTNLKRVRFSTSILFILSIGVELLTPMFSHYFLLLATIANIAKSISLAAYLATGSAIHRSFAIADNLGEVSAKAQIQTVCFDNLGLMLAAVLNMLCKNSQRLQGALPLAVYPIFAAVDLLAIYQGLKHVHLQTLTKSRLEFIIDKWIYFGFVPSPAEVSNEEGIFMNGKGSKLWTIRIGCIDPEDLLGKSLRLSMQSLKDEDFYFICMETSHKCLTRKQKPGILLCIRERASIEDIVAGVLQACLVRKALLRSTYKWESNLADGRIDDSIFMEWLKLVDDSKKHAQGEIDSLMEAIRRMGWAVKNILLNAHERIRYSWVGD